ncbi:MAG: ABC transporter permease subunit [Pseudonocardiaceae bacterium]|nr:ABC transporter permease subunit [Pseudonocardiaceae bacterium]
MTATTAETPTPVASAARRAPLIRLLRAELRWVFRRPRTLVVLGLLALIPISVGISAAIADSSAGAAEGPPLFSMMAGNGLALSVGTLAITIMLLLPLVTAMSSADAIAGESAHGTLRGLLVAPVGRIRLLGVKAFGVACVALCAVLVIAVTGFLTGLVMSGPDGLFTISGTTLSIGAALGKLAVAVGWVAVQLWAVGAVALAISAYTEHPMLVVVGVLAGDILFAVLGGLSALSWLHPFLITESWSALPDVLRDPMPTEALTEGTLRAACYIIIGLSLAGARMLTKDG